MRYWSFIAAAALVPLCLVATVLFVLAPYIIPHYMAVEVHLAKKAGYFVMISIPTVWALAGFRVVQKYLQAQSIMVPSMVCGGLSLVVVFVLNLIFVFALDGGYVGSAFSLLLTRMIMLGCLLYYVSAHPSVDVSVSIGSAASGAWNIMCGIAPRHAMFREQIIRIGLDRDEDDDHENTPLVKNKKVDIA